MPARIAAPVRMRVDATLEPSFASSLLDLVHVGHSAVVLRGHPDGETTGALLILTKDTSGLMPGGICLPGGDFRRVRSEILGQGQYPRRVQFNEWFGPMTLIDAVDLALGERSLSTHSILAHQRILLRGSTTDAAPGVMSPEPIRRLAPNIARRALRGDIPVETLRCVIGAGPGTTPSGDDVIVGVLAGLHSLGLGSEAAKISRLLMPLLPQTTSASRHYLSAAAHGRFGDHVHHLLDALTADGPAEQTLRNAARWGATSGMDLLVGLVSTTFASLGHRSMESAA